MNFYVRSAVRPDSLLPAIRGQIASIDPDLPVRELRTMKDMLASRMSNEYLLSRLTGIFGGLATLLAAIGLYGVLAFNVARRSREIGIRIALGAAAGHVRGLIVREIAIIIGIGALIGAGGAFAVGRKSRISVVRNYCARSDALRVRHRCTGRGGAGGSLYSGAPSYGRRSAHSPEI
jgi:predicted lysophospholipase L1 biosynthesis ABC-type transport system permease subunit